MQAEIRQCRQMPRRELLTPAQREQLLSFPTDTAELIRLYTLSEADHAFVKAHRGTHNRLGVAVQLAYLRFPVVPYPVMKSPGVPLLATMVAQLKALPSDWARKSRAARRDSPRACDFRDAVSRAAR